MNSQCNVTAPHQSIQSLMEGNKCPCGRGPVDLASVSIEEVKRVFKLVFARNLCARVRALKSH